MPIKSNSYFNCCSVSILSGFGLNSVRMGVKELQAHIKAHHNSMVALSAITNISQKKGIKALKIVGFKRTRKLQKPAVKNSKSNYNKIYIWHFELSNENVAKALAVDVSKIED